MALSDTSSFANNSIVQAMGSALGMGNMFPGLAAAAPAPAQDPNLKAPPVPVDETERIRDSRNVRQSYPHPANANAGGRGLQPGVGPGANMPAAMSPEVLMSPEVQQLMGQYGIKPEQLQGAADNANPNLFVQNQNAFQRHPVLANMLERGLEGLAFTQGGRTTGESISNVARGLMDANSARVDKYNNMLMLPFMQAGQVAGLQNMSTEEKLKQAQIQYDQSHANYFDQLPELRQGMIDSQNHYHQGMIDMRKMALNQKQMMDPRLGYLTTEQSDSLQQEMQSDDFDPNRFEHYAQLGQANHDQQRAQLAIKVAGVSASARNNSTGGSIDRSQLGAYQKQVDDAIKEDTVFQNNMKNGMTTSPVDYEDPVTGIKVKAGQFVTAGSPEAGALGGYYKNQIKDAQTQLNGVQTGIGVSPNPAAKTSNPSQKRIARYNPATGRIE